MDRAGKASICFRSMIWMLRFCLANGSWSRFSVMITSLRGMALVSGADRNGWLSGVCASAKEDQQTAIIGVDTNIFIRNLFICLIFYKSRILPAHHDRPVFILWIVRF